jgi:hypothetical protein
LSGLQKLSLKNEDKLTMDEETQLSKFLLPTVEELQVESLSFANSILKQASKPPEKKYINVNFIPAGSVMVESLFSIVGHMFTDRRLSTSPVHLEEQVFLRINSSLWNVYSFINMKFDESQL